MPGPVDPEELGQVARRFGFPVKGREAARAAKDAGASEEVVDFLEAIPGEIADESDLQSWAEATKLSPEPHPDNVNMDFPD